MHLLMHRMRYSHIYSRRDGVLHSCLADIYWMFCFIENWFMPPWVPALNSPVLSLYYPPAPHSMWSLRRPQFRFSPSLHNSCCTCRVSRRVWSRDFDALLFSEETFALLHSWNHIHRERDAFYSQTISARKIALIFTLISVPSHFHSLISRYFNSNIIDNLISTIIFLISLISFPQQSSIDWPELIRDLRDKCFDN